VRPQERSKYNRERQEQGTCHSRWPCWKEPGEGEWCNKSSNARMKWVVGVGLTFRG